MTTFDMIAFLVLLLVVGIPMLTFPIAVIFFLAKLGGKCIKGKQSTQDKKETRAFGVTSLILGIWILIVYIIAQNMRIVF